MVDDYIKQFLRLIRHGSNVNSYKLVWAKAIVEISTEKPDEPIITLNDIAKKVFKYYWNQTIYFDLTQGNNPNKRPEFVVEVRKKIDEYYKHKGNRQPIHFEKIEDEVVLNLNKLTGILKKDVSWRFLLVNGETLPVYQYKKGDNQLTKHTINNFYLFLHSPIFQYINTKWYFIHRPQSLFTDT